MLTRLLDTFPPSGTTPPEISGTPGVPGKVEPSPVKPDGGLSDLFRSEFTPAPKAPGAEVPPILAGDMKRDTTGDIRGVLNTQSVDAPPVTAPGNSSATTQPSQVQTPAMPLIILPVLQTIVLDSIDSSVSPRAPAGEFLKRSETLRRGSVDAKESGMLSIGNEATVAAPSPGFFSGVIRDILGILSDTGTKKESSDPKEDGPSGTKSGAVKVTPDPVLMDVPAGPAKKAVTERLQETQPVPATDITHQQVDLAALRTSQGALNSPAMSERLESAIPAAPLREVPTPYAPLPAEISRRIADQVVGKLNLQVDGAISEIRMTLRPPSLGEVQLSVHVEDSRMQAQISVSQQVVKTALEAHMPQLRLALQEHGIEIQRIDVMLPEQSLHRDGTGPGGDRWGRKGGRHSFSGDDPEAYQGVKDMGYNTIELIM